MLGDKGPGFSLADPTHQQGSMCNHSRTAWCYQAPVTCTPICPPELFQVGAQLPPGTHKLSFCFLQHRSAGMGAHICNLVLQSSPYLPPHSPRLKLFVTVLTLPPPKAIQACSKLVHRYAQALATLNPRSPLRLVRTQYTSVPWAQTPACLHHLGYKSSCTP